ncbi:arylsulfatase [Cenococcum geophilum 1.58]|uniref:Arylsulfatase n=1 Tax=Cenococcum geophilum 1.58 TaxID=794803 RepID=A0ACC8EMN0_9PEZI|nr:arylsulfatase [Cenococcum geophilum 1.58]
MRVKFAPLSGFGTAAAILAFVASLSTTAQAQQDEVSIPRINRGTNQPSRPNIVFILSDDQDVHLNSLDYMPHLKQHLLDQGTFFSRHYCTIALCCPSRVNLWTGRAGHNTNVTDVSPPYGGYPKFISQGLNDKWLPVWLQQSGYNTYYTGKLFNAHSVINYNNPFPAGFNGSDFLLDPYTYQYLNATFQRNHDPPVSHTGEYSTDILAQKAYGFLDDAVTAGKPFFLGIAPIACHSNVILPLAAAELPIFTAPIPAKRHETLFPDAIVPRTESFNPDQPSGANWIKKLPIQNESNVDSNDRFYRQRLRSLQVVDEIIDKTVRRLEQYGILENTYIIYSTDNGFHIGQHRMQPGKSCGYEEDINIPLIIRGPGVPAGETTDIVTTHTDLAPTIFDIIGIPPRPEFDGIAIPLTQTVLLEAKQNRYEHVNVEYWGFAIEEGDYGTTFHYNNTYKAIRVIGKSYSLYYSIWCNNEHELYDLARDPYQMRNIFPSNHFNSTQTSKSKLLGHPLSAVISRLDTLLFVLKSCKAAECVRPWETLHPQGNVQNLRDALSPKYDYFYEVEQRRVAYTRCEPGYIIDAEGPQFPVDGLIYRDGHAWSAWV